MPKRISLRTKLIALFMAIALVPLLAVTAVTTTQLQQTERQNALEHANQIAKAAREEISTFIVSQFSVLESIQAVYPVLSPKQRDDYIEQILFLSDTFTDLSVLNGSGHEIVRKNRIEVIKDEDLQDQSSASKFAQARDRGAYIGPLYLTNGKPFFTLSVALRSAGNTFLGVASAEVDARILQDVVKEASSVDKASRVYIVNQQGIVMAHPDISLVLGGTDLTSIPAVRAALTNAAFDPLKGYINDAQEEVIGTALPISFTVGSLSSTKAVLEPNWLIITEQRSSIALKAANDLLRLELVLLSLALIAATIAAIFVAGNIVQPIGTILGGLQQFGQNNLQYRVRVESNDETRDLADGFNRMAENLGKSVAELKEEREAMAVERNKLALVLSGITDAVIAIDLKGNIIPFNAAAEQLTNIDAKDAIGKPVDTIVSLSVDHKIIPSRTYCPAVTERTTENPPPYRNDSVNVERRNGRVANVSMLVTTLAASPGVNLGWIITLHDRTKEEVVESIKREFVSIAAHQLRTPLTAIKWATDMFLSGYAGKPSPEQTSLIEKAHQSTDRMIVLVNDLLNTARLEDGRLVGERKPTDIVVLMQTVIDNLKASIAQKKHTVTFIPPKEKLPLLVTDSETMILAFQNLVENAVRYTKAGGKINVTIERKNEHLAVAVSDNGVGVPEDQKERIFGKFFRGRNVINMETEGSGLGLFIAKNIVETHGGKVQFESQENKGTVVTISLPLVSRDTGTLPQPSLKGTLKKIASTKA